MHIDLTDPAESLGLTRTPDIVWAWRTPDGNDVLPARYHIPDRSIYLRPSALNEAPERWMMIADILGDRLPRPFNNWRDVVRFTTAHELAHTWQHQQMGEVRFLQQASEDALMQVLGIKPHHELTLEREADEWARALWRTVKIDGHYARGLR